MKKLFKLFILMLAVCGISCEQLANLFGDGNNGGNNGGNGTTSQNTFIINVSNITSDSANVNISPSNTDTYYFDVIEKSVFDSYTTSTQFANAYVEFLKEICSEKGYSFSDVLSSGSDSYSFGELAASTDYYVFVFGVNASGTITTNVSVKAFTTSSLGGGGNNGGNTSSNNTFAITVLDITSNSAYVEVTPSTNDTYFFDVIEKSVMDQYADKKELAADIVAMYAEYGYSAGDIASSGVDAYAYEGDSALEPNTEYYAYAFGLSSDGTVTTDVTVKSFTTLSSGSGNSPSTGDLALNNFTYGYYTNYGDYYGTGATNWYIDLYTDDTYDVLVLEVQTPTSATNFLGTFSFNSNLAANTAVSYFIDDEGYKCGSYWCLLDSDYNIVDYRGCVSGSVKFSKSGDNYTVVVDALDDSGNKITSNYTGALEEYVPEYSTMSRSVVKNPARRFSNIAKIRKQSVATPKLSIKKAVGVKQPLKITLSKRFN